MQKIRLTKEFGFEAAHALHNYDGKCKNIHGHSYKLFVTVLGVPEVDENATKYGMVMDFGDLKKIINTLIVDKFDHALVLSSKSEIDKNKGKELFERFVETDYQPTCENMLVDFADKISPLLPQNVKLHSLKLYETANSYAEWFASDQE